MHAHKWCEKKMSPNKYMLISWNETICTYTRHRFELSERGRVLFKIEMRFFFSNLFLASSREEREKKNFEISLQKIHFRSEMEIKSGA